LSQFIEKFFAFFKTALVFDSLRTETPIIAGSSETDMQLFAGIAATNERYFAERITGT